MSKIMKNGQTYHFKCNFKLQMHYFTLKLIKTFNQMYKDKKNVSINHKKTRKIVVCAKLNAKMN